MMRQVVVGLIGAVHGWRGFEQTNRSAGNRTEPCRCRGPPRLALGGQPDVAAAAARRAEHGR